MGQDAAANFKSASLGPVFAKASDSAKATTDMSTGKGLAFLGGLADVFAVDMLPAMKCLAMWVLVLGVYIRYEHYEPGKQKWKLRPGKSSYKQGYGIAGAFLAWLEKNKDPEIIRKLNRASKEGSYKPEMFKESCGAELDALWDEYVKETVKK